MWLNERESVIVFIVSAYLNYRPLLLRDDAIGRPLGRAERERVPDGKAVGWGSWTVPDYVIPGISRRISGSSRVFALTYSISALEQSIDHHE